MYIKGQWAAHKTGKQVMRVARDQNEHGPDAGFVWCEWLGPGYRLSAFTDVEIALLPLSASPGKEQCAALDAIAPDHKALP